MKYIHIETLKAFAQLVESNPGVCGGSLVFKNTRLTVEHIAHIVQHSEVTKQEVMEDYPHLTPQMLELAENIILDKK